MLCILENVNLKRLGNIIMYIPDGIIINTVVLIPHEISNIKPHILFKTIGAILSSDNVTICAPEILFRKIS